MKCAECGLDLRPGELYVEARVIPHDPPTLAELGGPRFIHARPCPAPIEVRDGHYWVRVGGHWVDLGPVEEHAEMVAQADRTLDRLLTSIKDGSFPL